MHELDVSKVSKYVQTDEHDHRQVIDALKL